MAWPVRQAQPLDPDDAHVNLGALGVDPGDRDGAGLPSQAAGEVERLGMADRVDREVDAAAAGELLHPAARVVLGQVDRHGAERLGRPQPLLHRVDRDHQRRAGRPRHLHRAQAHRAEAEHRDRRARLERVRLRRIAADRVVGGPRHVAGEQRHLVREPLGDTAKGQVGLRDEQELRLRSLQRAERGAVAEDPAGVALVVLGAPAVKAAATGGGVGAQHPVGDRDLAHRVAGGDHGPHVLVADHEAGLDRDAAVVDVEVGAADPGRLDPDHDVVGGGGLGLRALVDPNLAGGLEGDRAHRAGG